MSCVGTPHAQVQSMMGVLVGGLIVLSEYKREWFVSDNDECGGLLY